MSFVNKVDLHFSFQTDAIHSILKSSPSDADTSHLASNLRSWLIIPLPLLQLSQQHHHAVTNARKPTLSSRAARDVTPSTVTAAVKSRIGKRTRRHVPKTVTILRLNLHLPRTAIRQLHHQRHHLRTTMLLCNGQFPTHSIVSMEGHIFMTDQRKTFMPWSSTVTGSVWTILSNSTTFEHPFHFTRRRTRTLSNPSAPSSLR